jgi:hypothetical protein
MSTYSVINMFLNVSYVLYVVFAYKQYIYNNTYTHIYIYYTYMIYIIYYIYACADYTHTRVTCSHLSLIKLLGGFKHLWYWLSGPLPAPDTLLGKDAI